ncbi:MAG: SPOR domain-containing protein [Candidatus Omnitrophica bacterium]|nr:SPOR domain-containing protein [Candidatus Omnitrophota bacterium]
MEENAYQKELFEFEPPKASAPKKPDPIFPKGKFSVTLTLDRLVFVSIGVIMLMVALYALGVEKGKHYTGATAAKKARQASPAKQAGKAKYTVVVARYTRKETALAEVSLLRSDKLNAFAIQSAPYFLVCVGGYATKEDAQSAVKRLKPRFKDAYIKARI